jgi:GMP synthase (glutamine-hydrolysing)
MRVLALQHIACEHPGVMTEVLLERGAEITPVELDRGEPLPERRDYDAVLVMGGPMGATDDRDHPWLAAERRLVREAVEDGQPFLGVCLGAQLLAAALGAPIRRLDRAEVGLLPVELTPEGREHRLLEGIEEPLVTLQWHGDTFELPPGAIRLASSPVAANQAFGVGGRAFGVQFHLEVTPEMAREWAGVPAYRRSLAETLGEEAGRAFLAEVERRGEELHPAARRLCSNWLDLASDGG